MRQRIRFGQKVTINLYLLKYNSVQDVAEHVPVSVGLPTHRGYGA